MSHPEVFVLVLVLLAFGIVFITFRVAYACGYRQGQCDTARTLASFERLKTIERFGYDHGRN